MNLRKLRLIDYYAGGVLLLVFKLLTVSLGRLFHRNHDPRLRGTTVVVKMLGGGSLLLALPTLLGLKRAHPEKPFILVTTEAVLPFAQVLDVFDRLVVVRTNTGWGTIFSALKAFAQCLGCDTAIDLEVHSRLSTMFCLFTLARNRIGFYLDTAFWRRGIHTHLIFFNRFAPVHIFYSQIAFLLGTHPVSDEACRAHILKRLPAQKPHSENTLALGHGCSPLAPERMLESNHWVSLFNERALPADTHVHFLGSQEERASADKIISLLSPRFPTLTFLNDCGRLSLKDSLSLLAGAKAYWGIDSSLLHFARLLGIPSVSFWGPTHPNTLLKPMAGLKEEVFYAHAFCSPCLHIASKPPCGGNNLCIQKLFDKNISLKGEDSLLTVISPSEKTQARPSAPPG